MTDLSLVSDADLIAALQARCDVFCIVMAREQVHQDGQITWQVNGDHFKCLGLLEQLKFYILSLPPQEQEPPE